MRHRRIQRIPRIGILTLLLGGVLLASTAIGVASAVAQSANPLGQILTKENEILNAINSLQTPPPPTNLNGVTQNWDKKLSGASRFTVLADFGGAAVRDNETGLVWEQSPSTTPMNWIDGIRTCWLQEVGGRKGWHLPTIEELASLVDPTVPTPGPALPPGHPFYNIQPGVPGVIDYWSTTLDVRPSSGQAWVVRFGTSGVTQIGDNGKDGQGYRWCVRGGTHGDKYK